MAFTADISERLRWVKEYKMRRERRVERCEKEAEELKALSELQQWMIWRAEHELSSVDVLEMAVVRKRTQSCSFVVV